MDLSEKFKHHKQFVPFKTAQIVSPEMTQIVSSEMIQMGDNEFVPLKMAQLPSLLMHTGWTF